MGIEKKRKNFHNESIFFKNDDTMKDPQAFQSTKHQDPKNSQNSKECQWQLSVSQIPTHTHRPGCHSNRI